MQIDCRPLYVRSVVEKVTMGQVSHQVLKFSCTIIIPSVYFSFSFMTMLLLPENKYVMPGNFQKEMLFQDFGSTG
jgi:hypothetical protein